MSKYGGAGYILAAFAIGFQTGYSILDLRFWVLYLLAGILIMAADDTYEVWKEIRESEGW